MAEKLNTAAKHVASTAVMMERMFGPVPTRGSAQTALKPDRYGVQKASASATALWMQPRLQCLNPGRIQP